MIRRLIILLLIVGCDILQEEDCAGVAGGDAVVDDCGICNGIADYVAGTCYDCAGIPNGSSILSGCDNTCNSTAVTDCAGVCDGNSSQVGSNMSYITDNRLNSLCLFRKPYSTNL